MMISRNDLFVSILCLVCAGSFLLLAGHMLATGSDDYFFLLWNLCLAAAPLVFAFSFERAATAVPVRMWRAGVWFVLWFFFFPNAPYIMTDFIHLPWEYARFVHFWYDFFLIASFSCAGLLFGMASLFLVHRSLRRIIGRFGADVTAVFVVLLSGVGMYFGRFLRWNSWDVFVSADDIVSSGLSYFADPALFRDALVLSFLFSIFVGISYAIFLGTYRFLGKRR